MKINGLDEKDNLIVSLLMKNARMSFTDIGEEVGLTRVAVKNRVKALEEKGVIKGYHAMTSLKFLPYGNQNTKHKSLCFDCRPSRWMGGGFISLLES